MAGRHLAGAHDRVAVAEYPIGIPNGGSSGHGRRGLVDPGGRLVDDASASVDTDAGSSNPEFERSGDRSPWGDKL